jgi:hypothetical protein
LVRGFVTHLQTTPFPGSRRDGRGPHARIGDDGGAGLDLKIGSTGSWMICAGKPGTGRGLR